MGRSSQHRALFTLNLTTDWLFLVCKSGAHAGVVFDGLRLPVLLLALFDGGHLALKSFRGEHVTLAYASDGTSDLVTVSNAEGLDPVFSDPSDKTIVLFDGKTVTQSAAMDEECRFNKSAQERQGRLA